jgi:hypothetical protein
MEKYFEIDSSAGKIKCKFYINNPENIDTVILSSHGFCGSKESDTTKALFETLPNELDNVSVLTFDWPCHGEDENQVLDLDKCDTYITAIIDYIKNNLGIDKIYSQATSFGGYLVLKYITEHENPFEKIALRCPAINMLQALETNILTQDELNKLLNNENLDYGYGRQLTLTKAFLDSLAENDILNRDFTVDADKLLIMHGTSDEIIDFNTDQEFCNKNGIPFIPIAMADHRFQGPGQMEECLSKIFDFYDLKKEKKL